MSLLGLLTSLALVASASAICCSPEKYTVNVRSITNVNGIFYEGKGVQYVDAVNGMYVTAANYTDGKGVPSFATGYHNILSGDHYNVIGGHCTKTKFEIPGIDKAHPNCVPDNVKGPSFTVGGPHEDLELFQIKTPLKNGIMENTFTKHHCLIVQQAAYVGQTIKNKFKVTYAHYMEFANLKPSVADLSVLVLPDICKHATS